MLYKTVFLCVPAEDAKRMAIKEEQYDPGYEVAYGGAYGEPGSEEANGHCAFASGEAG